MKKYVVVLVGLMLVQMEGTWLAGAAEKELQAVRPAVGAAAARKIVATGTIEPAQVVDVSAQVAGMVMRLGSDRGAKGKSIDYGSIVKAGDMLAQIDAPLYAVRVERAQAALARAAAELEQARIRCKRAEAEWKRTQDPKKQKNRSESDVDSAKSDFDFAKTSVAAAEASLHANKTELEWAKTELGYTIVKSPIAGTIIDRRVKVGQRVTPNAKAPSLFLIGTLDQLQVWACVNEADIGRIRTQQPAHFTVDAYPGKTFHGTVDQIRVNAAMTQNVVTYTVVIRVTSPTEGLLPYLTARVEFD